MLATARCPPRRRFCGRRHAAPHQACGVRLPVVSVCGVQARDRGGHGYQDEDGVADVADGRPQVEAVVCELDEGPTLR